MKVRDLVNVGYSNVIITSPGGNHVSAINIAKVLNDNQINLIVDGVCFSACAQELVLGVNSVNLRKNSLVAFHQSGTFMHLFAKTHMTDKEEYVSHTKKISDIEKHFFNELNIDHNALIVPSEVINYQCFANEIRFDRGDYFVKFVPTHDWYVPQKQVLEGWRRREGLVGGIVDQSDFLERTKLFPSLLKSYSFAFGKIRHTKNIDMYINGIEPCEER